MILAAGRGERMRPLTDTTPKPLLKVQGKPLIVDKIEKLKDAGIREIIINLAWLGDKIIELLGDGRDFGLSIAYSKEPPGALETAGGIIEVLDFFDNQEFLVVNADIWGDFDFKVLSLPRAMLANLLLLTNPEHKPNGDFCLKKAKIELSHTNKKTYTFSGIGIYHPDLFKKYPKGRRALIKVLNPAIAKGQIAGVLHHGSWFDIGSKERLQFVNDLEPAKE